MFNLAKYFIVSAIISLFTISAFANFPGASTDVNEVQTRQGIVQNLFSSDSKINQANAFWNNVGVMNSAAFSDASGLAGVWRMTGRTNVCAMQAEVIFQPNGGYSSFTQCANGAYAIHLVGRWRVLQNGAVRVQYTDYSPKQYLGNPIRIPDGETIYYQFIDRNRVKMFGTVAYRAQ